MKEPPPRTSSLLSPEMKTANAERAPEVESEVRESKSVSVESDNKSELKVDVVVQNSRPSSSQSTGALSSPTKRTWRRFLRLAIGDSNDAHPNTANDLISNTSQHNDNISNNNDDNNDGIHDDGINGNRISNNDNNHDNRSNDCINGKDIGHAMAHSPLSPPSVLLRRQSSASMPLPDDDDNRSATSSPLTSTENLARSLSAKYSRAEKPSSSRQSTNPVHWSAESVSRLSASTPSLSPAAEHPDSLAASGQLWTEERRAKATQVRAYILQELIQTEKNYVANLQLLRDVFARPLSRPPSASSSPLANSFPSLLISSTPNPVKSNAIVAAIDVKLMFSWVDDLLHFATLFSEALSAGDQAIGSLFLQHSQGWQVYMKFIDCYAMANDAMRRNDDSNTAFRQFVVDALKQKCHRQFQSLSDFLILPIQRITRYVLLLQDLLKHTPSDHDDYNSLTQALNEMKILASTVNEVKRDEEEMTRMFSVLRCVEGCPPTIISAYRRVLFEIDAADVGKEFHHLSISPPATRQSNSSSNANLPTSSSASIVVTVNAELEGAQVRLFIFSDVLMVAKSKSKKKKEKPSSKFVNPGISAESAGKKEKFSMFRLAWLRDCEVEDVESSIHVKKEKTLFGSKHESENRHLIKLWIHSEIDGCGVGKSKMFADLARDDKKMRHELNQPVQITLYRQTKSMSRRPGTSTDRSDEITMPIGVRRNTSVKSYKSDASDMSRYPSSPTIKTSHSSNMENITEVPSRELFHSEQNVHAAVTGPYRTTSHSIIRDTDKNEGSVDSTTHTSVSSPSIAHPESPIAFLSTSDATSPGFSPLSQTCTTGTPSTLSRHNSESSKRTIGLTTMTPLSERDTVSLKEVTMKEGKDGKERKEVFVFEVGEYKQKHELMLVLERAMKAVRRT